MARGKRVVSVDVLPLDLELWTAPGYGDNPDRLRSVAETTLENTVLEAIQEKHYEIAAMVDWNGDYDGGHALDKKDLMATVGALAGYGAFAAAHPGTLPVPFLPARLGDASHADATLFVGGWSFVGNAQDSTANSVGRDIAIGLLVVTVVVVLVLAASALGKHGHGGDHEHHGGWSGGGGGGGRAVAPVRLLGAGARIAADIAVDAFGRSGEAPPPPDWADDSSLPRDGDSQLYLEMTLVDNHTGLTLWHVHQQFPADANVQSEVTHAARVMLASLPRS